MIVHKSHFWALLFLALARFEHSAGAEIAGLTPASIALQKFCGDAIMVTKTDSASALIYWDGKRYGWYQQAD